MAYRLIFTTHPPSATAGKRFVFKELVSRGFTLGLEMFAAHRKEEEKKSRK